MVKFLMALLLSAAVSLAAPNQTVEPISPHARENFDISSEILKSEQGQIYKIFYAVPKGAKKQDKILFMTDGNAQFVTLLNLYERGAAPLIVGIGYDTNLAYDVANRTRDYTPKAAGEEFSKGGGADKFYKFIKEILLPRVEAKFDAKQSEKCLYGHSFGGLFALFVLLQNEGVFDEFFIASPSLWWGDSEILKNAVQGGKFKESLKAKFIWLGVGELEKRAGKTDRGGILSARDLAKILDASGVKNEFKIYEGQTHGGVIPLVLKDVLKYFAQ